VATTAVMPAQAEAATVPEHYYTDWKKTTCAEKGQIYQYTLYNKNYIF
jgi:hypothetical protein